MLRELAGEQPLQLALSAWRTQPVRPDTPAAQARAFQALLEKTSGKDLGWFFDSWVLEDRGLPDLSIVEVTPRQLPAGQGHDTGWLVAVTVRNSGAATADVPLSIRSGPLTTNKRIRVPGLSSVTNREVLRSAPTEIVLNDGSTPEAGAAVHTRSVVVRSE
jgi:aminopeptidase N